MIMKVARQPIIILGMHRSGTSMVTEFLQAQGLFIGKKLEDNHESVFFVDLNTQIMQRSSATWDYPKPVLDFFACKDAVNMTAAALAEDLSSRQIKHFFNQGRLDTYTQPWGWKDPRTVFTLPLWLRLFPQAKLIYIVRNGIDVAKSLMVREKKLLTTRTARFDRRMKKLSLRSHLDRAGYKGSPRCLSMQGGFDLWSEYMQQADENLHDLNNEILTVRYEDILQHPQKHLAELANFCGLKVATETIEQASGQIDNSRALAFADDPELSAFYQRVKQNQWMTRFDYGTISRRSEFKMGAVVVAH